MKKKVVILSETSVDGVGKHIRDLIEYLDLSRIDLTIIHSKDRVDDQFHEVKERFSKEVKFYQVDELIREIGLLDVKAFLKIRKIIKGIQPDVLHCHSSKAGVLGRIIGKLSRVKKVYYTPHAYSTQNAMLSKKKYILYTLIERILGSWFTDKTIHVSKGETAFAIEHGLCRENLSIVIYNGISDNIGKGLDSAKKQMLRQEWEIPEEDIIIGTVARLWEQKNPEEFLVIAKNIVSKYPKVTFVWVGGGLLLNDYIREVKALGLDNKIKYCDYQKDSIQFMEIFDVFISTALYEGLPYTLIEAMRSKCPIVATDVVGNNECVNQEVNGLLYPLGDINKGSEALERLIKDVKLRQSYGQKGYELFVEQFTIQQMIEKHMDIYLR